MKWTSRLRYSKLYAAYWKVRYAIQRVIKGYDYRDVFNLNDNFQSRMLKILKDYRENYYCLLTTPSDHTKFIKQGYIDEADRCKTYTAEQGDAILDVMIHRLERMDEDFVIEMLYGKDCYEKDIKIDYSEVDRIRHQNTKLFFHMFELLYDQLWY